MRTMLLREPHMDDEEKMKLVWKARDEEALTLEE